MLWYGEGRGERGEGRGERGEGERGDLTHAMLQGTFPNRSTSLVNGGNPAVSPAPCRMVSCR